jgi:VanZ family protein
MREQFRLLTGKRRQAIIILSLLIILTLAFIFGNSLEDRETSAATSAQFERFVEPVLLALPYEQLHTKEALSITVRKLAHYSEFFLLGAEMMALSILLRSLLIVRKRLILLFALLFAGIDEMLQFISRRAPQVQDALLDTFGALCGICFVYAAHRLYTSLTGGRAKGGAHA